MILFSLGKQKNHGDKRCKDLSDRDGVPDAVNVKNQRENENRGCLEQYASATGIVRVAKRVMEATDEESVLRGFSRLSAKNVLDAYKEGDKLAAKVMDEVGEKLGSALAVFACVVDPEAIVIGGGVSRAGQPLIDCIETHYKKYAFSACKETPIILAKLGNDAGIYGSARMVI